MVMRVDTQTALQKRVERRGLQMVNFLKDQKIEGVTVTSNPTKLELTLKAPDAATLDKVEKELEGLRRLRPHRPRPATRLSYQLRDTQVVTLQRGGGGPGDARHPPPHRQVGRGRGRRAQAGHRRDPDLAPRPAGPGAGQGTHRHHRAARVPDGGRQESPTSGTCSPSTPRRPIPASSLVRTNGYEQLEGKEREPLLAYAKQDLPADREVLLQCVTTTANRSQGHL